MPRSKWFSSRATLLVGIVVMMLGSWSCSWAGFSGKSERITVGIIGDVVDVPILIADQRGFFKSNGLDVTLREYETGVAAADALVKGEVDLAAPTEFVVVGKAFKGEEISVIATFAKNQTVYLIARKDRGIDSISDLRGKRIGLSRGTINEFYLGRLLDLRGMSLRDVALIDLKPAQFVDAFSAGDVDALIGRKSVVDQVTQQFLDATAAWPAQSDQPVFVLLTVKNDWLEKHPELVKRLLRSIDSANGYIASHPKETKAIIRERLLMNESQIAEVWPDTHFALSLDLSLIVAMNDEARWMKNNNLIDERQPHDFMAHIYVDGLRAVKPEAVNIAR